MKPTPVRRRRVPQRLAPARTRKLLAEQLETRDLLSTIYSFEGPSFDGFSQTNGSGGNNVISSADGVLGISGAYDGSYYMRLRSTSAGTIQIEKSLTTTKSGDTVSIFGVFNRNGGTGFFYSIISNIDRPNQHTICFSDSYMIVKDL